MARIRLKVTATGFYNLDTEEYVGAWQEHCDDEGSVEEGNDYPGMPESFALEKFQEDIESGDASLDLILETADIDVKVA